MEIMLQFVSRGPIGLPRNISLITKCKCNTKPISQDDWFAVKLWAKDTRQNLIELMEKNEPNTKIKIYFVVTKVKAKNKSLLKKLTEIFAKPEPPVYLATVACLVDFQQPRKEWEKVLLDEIIKVRLAISTAPKVVQDKILDNQSGYVDLTKDLLENHF